MRTLSAAFLAVCLLLYNSANHDACPSGIEHTNSRVTSTRNVELSYHAFLSLRVLPIWQCCSKVLDVEQTVSAQRPACSHTQGVPIRNCSQTESQSKECPHLVAAGQGVLVKHGEAAVIHVASHPNGTVREALVALKVHAVSFKGDVPHAHL
jgi:hypothetical protein